MKFRGHRVIWSVKLWPHPRETTHPNQIVAILILKGTVLYSDYYFNHMATYHVQTYANFLAHQMIIWIKFFPISGGVHGEVHEICVP